MFLFEGNFGNILHTGDCRLTPECLQSLPEKYVGKNGKEPRCQLDYVFLDCTFGSFVKKFPVSIQQFDRYPCSFYSRFFYNVWGGLRHAAVCLNYDPYCKPCKLYFAILTWDWNVQKLQMSYNRMYSISIRLIQNLFYGCLPVIFSILLLCIFSLFYVKVIFKNLCKQYSESVTCESWPFFCR